MIVCLCKGVTERDVRSCIRRGANTVEALQGSCEAATDCGTCRSDLQRMLNEQRNLLARRSGGSMPKLKVAGSAS